jgi:CRISPR type II-A/NMEMI-associated protein Csn2
VKLVHPDFFFQIELPENKVPVLVFESPSKFLEFVSQIKGQVNGDNGEWVLSENGKELNLAKTCEVIIDVFALDINQKKMVTSLYNHLEKDIFNCDLLSEWNSIYSVLANFSEKTFDLIQYNLKYRDSIEIKDFFKFMNISFEDSSDNVLEKILNYMELASEIMGIRLFILCNIKSYLDYKQLTYLYEQAFYKKYHLLLIESHCSVEKNNIENTIIIDQDNCIIS